MSRKAEPPSRRPSRRRVTPDPEVILRPASKISGTAEEPQDSDFGLCLALAPALRRRPHA